MAATIRDQTLGFLGHTGFKADPLSGKWTLWYTKQMLEHRDISKQQFGRLTALRYTKAGIWECLCICGNTTTVAITALQRGYIRSCGCLRKETKRGKALPKTHCKKGHTLTSENTYKLASGYAVCKECERARVAANKKKAKSGK